MDVNTVREALTNAADRVRVIRYDPPPVSIGVTLIAVALVAAIGIGGAWYVRHARDAWWRERIAASSAVVESIVRKGATVATATDADIVQGIADAENRRQAAEQALRDVQSRPPASDRDRCRVPVGCVR